MHMQKHKTNHGLNILFHFAVLIYFCYRLHILFLYILDLILLQRYFLPHQLFLYRDKKFGFLFFSMVIAAAIATIKALRE